MRWTYKLSEEEFKLFSESLRNLFGSINAKVILDNNPTKISESTGSFGQSDSFENYNYNIKINSNLGNYEIIQGFVDDIDIKIQIKNIVKTIGIQYCLKYDFNKKTALADEIDKIK